MKKILPFFALLLSLAGPLAYADSGNSNKDKDASATNSQPATQNNQQGACPAQDQKQDKQKTIPSDQEKEFERVLMGIWG